jgi:hypothetical protein
MIGHTGGLCAALSGLVMYCVAIITQGVALGSYVSRRWRCRLPEQLLKGHLGAPTKLRYPKAADLSHVVLWHRPIMEIKFEIV